MQEKVLLLSSMLREYKPKYEEFRQQYKDLAIVKLLEAREHNLLRKNKNNLFINLEKSDEISKRTKVS